MKAAKNSAIPLYSRFREILPSNIKPQGWLREFLERQRDGMSGHFAELGYPFDTCLWSGQIQNIHLDDLFYPNAPQKKEFKTWWPYEQCAYLLDALVRLGLLLDDSRLVALFRQNLNYVIGTAEANGHLAQMASVDHSEWPMAVFFRAVAAYQQAHPERKTVAAWHRHYQSLTVADLAEYFRNITNLEGVLQTAVWTGDAALIAKAEAAYRRFDEVLAVKHRTDYYEEIGAVKLASGQKVVNHGVTCCEEIKLPILLYIHTGKPEYLDVAVRGMEKLLHDHLLPTGLVSSEEFLSGTGATRGYESCVITDLTWSLGYYLQATGEGRWADRIEKAIFNALPGSITKDFTAIQYMSSGNQVVMDGFAHRGAFLHGITSWRQYRPNQFPQCCPANIQRAMPNYALRMWLQTPDGAPVAALYGPSEADFQIGGRSLHLAEVTEYPFSETIRFELHPAEPMTFPFTFRVPEWCHAAAVKCNGRTVKMRLPAGKFATLTRRFAPGDVIELTLPMAAEVKTDRQNNLTVERGPLLYAYPVPCHEVKEEPKKRFTPRRITPAGPWNYALDPQAGIEEVATATKGYPFDADGVRLKLRVSAQTITGYDELESGRYTPDIPLYYRVQNQKTELDLVPMGATLARIAAFPPVQNRQVVPVTTAHVLGPWPQDFLTPLDWGEKPLSADEFYDRNPTELQPNRDGFYDLIHHFRQQGELSALVQFRIYADRAISATLAIRAADRAELRLNDHPLGRLEAASDGEFHSWNFLTVKLRKGYNFLQVKVADGPRPSQYRDSWGIAVAAFRVI